MNYADIKFPDVANGTGVRVSLFVSGCTHHCKGCFNEEAWDFNYGKIFDDKAKKEILDILSKSYVDGISFLGGEPLDPHNVDTICLFIEQIKEKYPDKNIWIYTGYLYEEIINLGIINKSYKKILEISDILVDGKFDLDKKDIRLKFKGSSNQRIINLKKSLHEKTIIIEE